MLENLGAMRRISLLLASAVLIATMGVAVSPASADVGGCGARSAVNRALRNGAMETATLRTFDVEATIKKKIVNRGSYAEIEILVTRPAKEDPLGEGEPLPIERPIVEPAPDVYVGVGLYVGNVFLPGFGITGPDGIAKARIKIESYAPSNTIADVSIYAWKVLQDTPCLTIQEDGYRQYPAMFKVGS